jgi:hypothetical protein
MADHAEQTLTAEEIKDLEAFLRQHATLHNKMSAFQILLTSAQEMSSEERERRPSQLTQNDGSANEDGDSQDEEECNRNDKEEEAYTASNSNSDSEEELIGDNDNNDDDDDDDDDDQEDIPDMSQRSNRSTTPAVVQWREPFFEVVAAVQKPAYFYMVIFLLHSDSKDWLVKIGITRATETHFKERYSIYYRFFFYKIIHIPHCDDSSSFAYYDSQQKIQINNNDEVAKYRMTQAGIDALKVRYNVLNDMQTHIGDSSGEVFYLGDLTITEGRYQAHLQFFLDTLAAVAASPNKAQRSIALPYKTSTRIKQLQIQLFDLISFHPISSQHMHEDVRIYQNRYVYL